MVLFKESSLLFIMTEEISGAYKLVIYLSQTSLLFGRLPVLQLIKTSREADQEEEKRCESLHLYYEITR